MRPAIKLLWLALFACALPQSGVASPPGLRQLFETTLARVVFLKTDPGKQVLSRVIGVDTELVRKTSYDAFLERMPWETNRELRHELEDLLQRMESDLAKYRSQRGKKKEIAPDELFTPAEIKFLQNRAPRYLDTNQIRNILDGSYEFIPIPKGSTYQDTLKDFRALAKKAPPIHNAAGVPSLPESPELLQETLSWRRKIADRFRTYGELFKFFMLSEGQWKTIFRMTGRKFTPADVQMVRKINRLLSVLNHYARFRLVVKSFVQERPALYRVLNRNTEKATQEYLSGEMGKQQYLKARAEEAKRLQLNDVVNMAEERMLTALERVKELGGSTTALNQRTSAIEISERNIRAYDAHIGTAKSVIEDAKAEISRLGSGSTAGSESRIRALRQKISMEQLNLTLWSHRKSDEIRNLERLYFDFVQNYETLELFANLRSGRINTEEVAAFDLPEPFVVELKDVEVWAPIYERALYNSTNRLVLNEGRMYFKSRIGGTRNFIRTLNSKTGQFFGKRFSESKMGQEFKEYTQNRFIDILQRVGGVMKIGIPSGVAVTMSASFWDWLFKEEEKKDPKKDEKKKDRLNRENEDHDGDRKKFDPRKAVHPRRPGLPKAPPPLDE